MKKNMSSILLFTCIIFQAAHGMDFDNEEWFKRLSTGKNLSIDYFKEKLGWVFGTDKDGNTTLHWLARKNWEDRATGESYFKIWWEKYSYSTEAMNAQNKDGDTALNWAVMSGQVSIVKNLDYKTNKELQNKDGNTPLHLTAIYGWNSSPIAEALIKEGFSLYTKNKKGETVYDIAKAQKRQDLINTLSQYFFGETDLEKLQKLMNTKPPFTKENINDWLEILSNFSPDVTIQDKQYTYKTHTLTLWIIDNHDAAADPDYLIIKKLLASNPDLTLLDDNKNNCLHLSARNNQSPLTIDLLFEHLKKTQPSKISELIEARNFTGLPPLALAVNVANKNAVLRLLAEGATTEALKNLDSYKLENIINPRLDPDIAKLLYKPTPEAQAEAKKLLGLEPAKPAPTPETPKAEPKKPEAPKPEPKKSHKAQEDPTKQLVTALNSLKTNLGKLAGQLTSLTAE